MNPDSAYFGFGATASDKIFGDFAAEVGVQVSKSSGQTQFSLSYLPVTNEVYSFTVSPVGNYGLHWSKEQRSLISGRSSAFNPTSEDNVIRLELRGDIVTLYANGRKLDSFQQQDLARRGGSLSLGWNMFGPPSDGDVEVRFTDFRVYALEQ